MAFEHGEGQRNQLATQLGNLDRAFGMYRSELAHFASVKKADVGEVNGIDTEIGHMFRLWKFTRGQLAADSKRKPAAVAELREHMILEHLDAAYEAARSVGEGNADVPRLEAHVWNAHDELTRLVRDRQPVGRYATSIAKLVGELDRLKQSHPDVIATINGRKQIDHLRRLAK